MQVGRIFKASKKVRTGCERIVKILANFKLLKFFSTKKAPGGPGAFAYINLLFSNNLMELECCE